MTLRNSYTSELEQLKLQVEVMAVRVDQNLERMREVLRTGDVVLAEHAINADDDIDAMNVSLTERCYDLLRREQPVASDLRLVVSVIRILGELERVGDLALRVLKLGFDYDLIAAHRPTFDILLVMADEAIERVGLALRASATEDLDLANQLAGGSEIMEVYNQQLMAELLKIRGDDAVPMAVQTLVGGRSLERIADHSTIVGARLRYLITGDPDHLAAEVR